MTQHQLRITEIIDTAWQHHLIFVLLLENFEPLFKAPTRSLKGKVGWNRETNDTCLDGGMCYTVVIASGWPSDNGPLDKLTQKNSSKHVIQWSYHQSGPKYNVSLLPSKGAPEYQLTIIEWYYTLGFQNKIILPNMMIMLQFLVNWSELTATPAVLEKFDLKF